MKSKALFITSIIVSFVIGIISGSITKPPHGYYRTTQNLPYKSPKGVLGVVPEGSILILDSIARKKLAFMRTGIIVDANKLSEYTERIIVSPDTYEQYMYIRN